MENMLIIFS
ncbi:hypothetical protein VCHENC02_4023A, partial [Vibrio harveyi]